MKNRHLSSLSFIALHSIREIGLSECRVNHECTYLPARAKSGLGKAKPERFLYQGHTLSAPPKPMWLDKDGDVCFRPYIWVEYTDGTQEQFFHGAEIDHDLPVHVRETKAKAQYESLKQFFKHLRSKMTVAIEQPMFNVLVDQAMAEVAKRFSDCEDRTAPYVPKAPAGDDPAGDDPTPEPAAEPEPASYDPSVYVTSDETVQPKPKRSRKVKIETPNDQQEAQPTEAQG